MQLLKFFALFLAIVAMVGVASAGVCSEYKHDQFGCKRCCFDHGKEMRSWIRSMSLGCYCKGEQPANV